MGQAGFAGEFDKTNTAEFKSIPPAATLPGDGWIESVQKVIQELAGDINRDLDGLNFEMRTCETDGEKEPAIWSGMTTV